METEKIKIVYSKKKITKVGPDERNVKNIEQGACNLPKMRGEKRLSSLLKINSNSQRHPQHRTCLATPVRCTGKHISTGIFFSSTNI